MDRMTLPGLENHPALHKYLDRACKYLNDGDQDAAGNNLRKAIETMLQQYANDIPQVYDKNLSTMISSLRGLDVLTEEQIDTLDAMRLRGNATSHADEPGKPKREVSVGILKDDYETLFDEFLPAFVERFPEPVEKKPRVHPKYHANVDIRELGHPDIWYAASRDFENSQWYPDSYAQMEQFQDSWNLHLGDAVRFYEEEIYLFWIGQSNIIENGELRIPTELQGFFGAGGFTKRSYVDKYHNTQYELVPMGFSLFDSVRYLRSYCAETLYLPYDFSALPQTDWDLSQQPENLLPEFCMDFSRRMFVKGIKCILIPHPSAGMKALSFDAWKRQFPELQLLLLDEECEAFRAYIKEHENQPVGRRPVPQSLQVYWPAWAMDYPGFKSAGLSQDEILHLLSCFALPVRDVSKTVESFRARHPELPPLIVTGDSGELKPPVPGWFEDELQQTGFDRRQFMDMLRYMGCRISVRPASPQDMSGDCIRFMERRIQTPARLSIDQGGQTVTEYPSWAQAAYPTDPARALAQSAAMPVHPLDYEFREYLGTLPFDPYFDDSGLLRSIRAEGLGAPWLISDEEFEEAFAEVHAEEMASLATQYAQADGLGAPQLQTGRAAYHYELDLDPANPRAVNRLDGFSVSCIRYAKGKGYCYDLKDKNLHVWPQVTETWAHRMISQQMHAAILETICQNQILPPRDYGCLDYTRATISVRNPVWWTELDNAEGGEAAPAKRREIMASAEENEKTKAFFAYLDELPMQFSPVRTIVSPERCIYDSPLWQNWGLSPEDFEWYHYRRHAKEIEASFYQNPPRLENGKKYVPAYRIGQLVTVSTHSLRYTGRIEAVRHYTGGGWCYDIMLTDEEGALCTRINTTENYLTGEKNNQPKGGLLWRLTH